MLTRVAALLAREPEPVHVARYGPDEFLLVRPGAECADVMESVERLRRGIAELTSSSASRRACR